MTEMRGSWLCRTEADRRRVLDMEHRLKRVRTSTMAMLALALVSAGPSLGWWTLIPLAVCAAAFAAADHRLEKSRLPENRLALAWLSSELCIAAGVALTGGPRSPVTPWLAVPVVTLSARFGARGVTAGLACSVALMLAATLGVDPAYVVHHPAAVLFPGTLIAAVSILSTALMQSDLEHRGAAAVDSLTGLLNRNALTLRVAELRRQMALRSESVGLVIIDVDRFKAINDAHGHAVGDVVLQKIAARLGAALQAFDPIYRLGGEEFLVLLPGSGLSATRDVAAQLCRAVAEAPIGGLEVTVSCGASASGEGAFDFDRVLAAADDALYHAKRAGRNRARAQAVGEFVRRAPAAAPGGGEPPAAAAGRDGRRLLRRDPEPRSPRENRRRARRERARNRRDRSLRSTP